MSTINKILKSKFPKAKDDSSYQAKMKELQLLMMQTQQAMWAQKKRAVVLFEGFDAAGKGTCIRHLTEGLDPRSVRVVPISAPTAIEKGQHYLQRFWKNLPEAGHITIFDRSWYGRVLVEKVEAFTNEKRVKQAYDEINAFEKMLQDDGVVLIKIFLVVSKDEQLERFKARLEDPFKTWKITEEDVRNRSRWDEYVKASELMIKKCPNWTVIPSNHKPYARLTTLQTVTNALDEIRKNFKPDKTQLKHLTKELFG